jgi:hypothetical protein
MLYSSWTFVPLQGRDRIALQASPGGAMSEPLPWHRLFGLSWVDFFRGLPVIVELEKDLSLKQQLLDVVIVRKGTAPDVPAAGWFRAVGTAQSPELQVVPGGAGWLGAQ